MVLAGHEKSQVTLLSSILGTPHKVEAEVEAAVPSPLEVKQLWLRVVMDADVVEQFLGQVLARLMKLKKWHAKGYVKEEDVENAEEWHHIRWLVLKRMFTYRNEDAFIEEGFIEGGGI